MGLLLLTLISFNSPSGHADSSATPSDLDLARIEASYQAVAQRAAESLEQWQITNIQPGDDLNSAMRKIANRTVRQSPLHDRTVAALADASQEMTSQGQPQTKTDSASEAQPEALEEPDLLTFSAHTGRAQMALGSLLPDARLQLDLFAARASFVIERKLDELMQIEISTQANSREASQTINLAVQW